MYVRWIAAPMHLKVLRAQMSLARKTDCRFLITRKNHPLQTEHNDSCFTGRRTRRISWMSSSWRIAQFWSPLDIKLAVLFSREEYQALCYEQYGSREAVKEVPIL